MPGCVNLLLVAVVAELKLNFKRKMSHTKLLQCFYKMQEENLKISEVGVILTAHNRTDYQ